MIWCKFIPIFQENMSEKNYYYIKKCVKKFCEDIENSVIENKILTDECSSSLTAVTGTDK